MTNSGKAFGIALGAGVLLDWITGIPTIFDPVRVAEVLGQRPPGDPVWTAFSALLIVLISLFFIPAALDPYRYGMLAWLAVLVRIPVACFFLLLQPGQYPLFGYVALVMVAVQLPLLVKAMREAPYL